MAVPQCGRHLCLSPEPKLALYVLGRQGHAVGILWYERPTDLDGITELVGGWFRDHISPRLAEPETAMRGRVVVEAGEAAGQHRRKG